MSSKVRCEVGVGAHCEILVGSLKYRAQKRSDAFGRAMSCKFCLLSRREVQAGLLTGRQSGIAVLARAHLEGDCSCPPYSVATVRLWSILLALVRGLGAE
jgi:hypothetical protein